jgi:GGDEF domain-containing protein
MGGDEFAVALIESEAGAGDRFVARLGERVEGGGFPEGFAVSAGRAHFPSDADSSVELFRVADQRLYQAKSQD